MNICSAGNQQERRKVDPVVVYLFIIRIISRTICLLLTKMNLYASDKHRLFDSLVVSVLNYNVSIWGNGACSDKNTC